MSEQWTKNSGCPSSLAFGSNFVIVGTSPQAVFRSLFFWLIFHVLSVSHVYYVSGTSGGLVRVSKYSQTFFCPRFLLFCFILLSFLLCCHLFWLSFFFFFSPVVLKLIDRRTLSYKMSWVSGITSSAVHLGFDSYLCFAASSSGPVTVRQHKRRVRVKS